MKSLLTASILAAMATLVATPAAAVVYLKTATQTINYNISFTTSTQYNNSPVNEITAFQPFSFAINRFNPVGSNGQALTLTNVSVGVTSQLGGNISLDNGSGNARIGRLIYTIGSSFTIDLPGLTDFTVATTPGSTVIPLNIAARSQGAIGIGATSTSAVGNFTPDSFVPYIGTGTFNVSHSLADFFSDIVLDQGGKGSLSGTSNANVNGSFVITYTYLDPIPEPANWAMMIVGFGLIGAAARRQRALIT